MQYNIGQQFLIARGYVRGCDLPVGTMKVCCK